MEPLIDYRGLVGRYPMVWCGAILPPMRRHRYTQYDNTLTRVCHKAYEDGMKRYENDMKTTSSSDSAPSRVIVDLSVYPQN